MADLTQAVTALKASGTTAESTRLALQAAGRGMPGALRQDLADQLQALKTVRLGVVQPPQTGSGTRSEKAGWAHSIGCRFRVMHALLSDELLSLEATS